MTELKTWDAEQQKYQLTKLSQQTDIFGYALKEPSETSESSHSPGANDCQEGVEAIAQS